MLAIISIDNYATLRFACGYRFKNFKMCMYLKLMTQYTLYFSCNCMVPVIKMYSSLTNLIYSIIEEVDFNVSYIDFFFFFFFFQGDQNTKQKKKLSENHHIVELDA